MLGNITSLVSIGELTVELHVGVSGIYNIPSSVLSFFYIIAYALDKICNIFRFIQQKQNVRNF